MFFRRAQKAVECDLPVELVRAAHILEEPFQILALPVFNPWAIAGAPLSSLVANAV
jgi:hypothetical protein